MCAIYSHSPGVRIIGPTVSAGYVKDTRITTRNMAPHDAPMVSVLLHLLQAIANNAYRSTLTLQSVAHYSASELESKSENGHTINIKSNKWALI